MKVRVGQALLEHGGDTKEVTEMWAARMRVVGTFWHCGGAGDVGPHPHVVTTLHSRLQMASRPGRTLRGEMRKWKRKCHFYVIYVLLMPNYLYNSLPLLYCTSVKCCSQPSGDF